MASDQGTSLFPSFAPCDAMASLCLRHEIYDLIVVIQTTKSPLRTACTVFTYGTTAPKSMGTAIDGAASKTDDSAWGRFSCGDFFFFGSAPPNRS